MEDNGAGELLITSMDRDGTQKGYDINLISKIEKAGLIYVGKDETGQRCEIMELEDHPYYVGTQYHPEFKSRPGRPSPPFLGLLKASIGKKI